jgi:hypothetical protein
MQVAKLNVNPALTAIHLSLSSSGQLAVTNHSGGFKSRFLSKAGVTNNLHTYRNPTIPIVFPTCTVRTDVAGFIDQEVLKCDAQMPADVYTAFRVSAGSASSFLYGTSDLVTTTATNYSIELRVFRGSACL